MVAYVGWCPTITGRLSFNSLCAWENTASPTHVCVEPEPANAPSGRLVVAHHDRASNDHPGLSVVRAVLGSIGLKRLALRQFKSDRFDYFLIGRTEVIASEEALRGEVIFLVDGADSALWRQTLRPLIEDLKQRRPTTLAEITASHDKFKAQVALLKQISLSRSPFAEPFYTANFTLLRSGELTIEPTPNPPPVPSALPPGTTVPARRQTQPTAQFYSLMDEAERANLLFRFVRDLFHPHYHHKTSNDSITLAHDTRGTPSWQIKTERALYRTVISARRGMKTQDLAMAQGRLAYLSAFRSTFQNAAGLPQRDLPPLEQSLSAAIASEESKDALHRAVITGLFILPFALLGLLISWVDAFQPVASSPLRQVELLLRLAYGFATSSVAFLSVIVIGTIVGYFHFLRMRTTPRVGVEREVARLGEDLRRKQRQARATHAGPTRGFWVFMSALAAIALITLTTSLFMIVGAATSTPARLAYREIALAEPFSEQTGQAISLLGDQAMYFADGRGAAPELRIQCWDNSLSVAFRSGTTVDVAADQVRWRITGAPAHTAMWFASSDRRFLLLRRAAAEPFIRDLLQAEWLVAQRIGDPAHARFTLADSEHRALRRLLRECKTPPSESPA